MGFFNKTDNFFLALKSAPMPKENELIFPYDYSIKNYNTSTFEEAKFRGAANSAEIEAFKAALKPAVANFEVKKLLKWNITLYVLLGSFAAGFLFLALFAGFGIPELGLALFVLLAASGVIFAIFFRDHNPEKQLIEREKQVKAYLTKANETWAPKGLSWKISKYGAYLVLTDNRPKPAGFNALAQPVVVNGSIGMAIPVARPASAEMNPPIEQVEVTGNEGQDGHQNQPYEQVPQKGNAEDAGPHSSKITPASPPQTGRINQVGPALPKVSSEAGKMP